MCTSGIIIPAYSRVVSPSPEAEDEIEEDLISIKDEQES